MRPRGAGLAVSLCALAPPDRALRRAGRARVLLAGSSSASASSTADGSASSCGAACSAASGSADSGAALREASVAALDRFRFGRPAPRMRPACDWKLSTRGACRCTPRAREVCCSQHCTDAQVSRPPRSCSPGAACSLQLRVTRQRWVVRRTWAGLVRAAWRICRSGAGPRCGGVQSSYTRPLRVGGVDTLPIELYLHAAACAVRCSAHPQMTAGLCCARPRQVPCVPASHTLLSSMHWAPRAPARTWPQGSSTARRQPRVADTPVGLQAS